VHWLVETTGYGMSTLSVSELNREPPKPVGSMRLSGYRDTHAHQTIVVCGCGTSLTELTNPQRYTTIGVNDVGRLFDPTYLLVVNPRSQFKGDRFSYVEQSNAQALFTQLDLGPVRPPVVRFKLGQYGGTDIGNGDVLHYTQNSPYAAVCLAAYMGARRIGLIGVDLTDNHFFAATGRHPLAGRLHEIDAQYGRLAAALRKRGVELVNLSSISRLTSLPKADATSFLRNPPNVLHASAHTPRVFFVHYQFLSCGEVFARGLENAAQDLGVDWESAPWDDARLREKVAAFGPDLLFVVHGRRFKQRWAGRFRSYRSAVWLLDEPYEVDDTAATSRLFQTVFVNDPSTLACHANAHYLPVAWDPHVHAPGPEEERCYDLGFIGGGNPTREVFLLRLARAGMLSYVVGGPWRSHELRALSLGTNVPPARTAELYRQTRVVVNVFRDTHHYNRKHLPATALNPRIYEALACGALVVSEARPELTAVFPELPSFHDADELVASVRRVLSDAQLRAQLLAASRQRLAPHTYAERLRSALALAVPNVVGSHANGANPLHRGEVYMDGAGPVPYAHAHGGNTSDVSDTTTLFDGWRICGPVRHDEIDGTLVLRSTASPAPGSERGLVTTASHRNIGVSFEAFIPSDACFIAKVNQAAQTDQCTNSYHLYCESGGAYLARHVCVFANLDVPRDTWVRLHLAYDRGLLSIYESDRLMHSVWDAVLPEGFAFIGVKSGEVRVRNVQIVPPRTEEVAVPAGANLICAGNPELRPRVTIVTTVYDRVECLERCLRSVRALNFQEYEHIVVSDCPSADIVQQITALVQSFGDGRISYLNLQERHNDWGIAPAAAGLRRARGEYVSFLSDDNGYTPQHVATLVSVLDRNRAIGFAYSSCQYGGRLVLRHPMPAPARIDLGQPMFRRELFRTYLADDLPFHMMAWDWALIDTLMKRGVRWQHVDVPSFIFRLACYPQLMVHG
jgi:hypothetical protein